MAKKQKVVLCRNCNSTMAKGTKICPSCGAKNKKPFYKKWWFVLIVVIAVMGLVNSIGGGDSEKIEWDDLELGELLPVPASNKGRIIIDSDDNLSVYIDKMSKADYNDYIDECEEMGYVVEADKNGNNFSAYNEEGYALSLYYAESSEELHIGLDAPEELGAFTWPNSDLAKLIPEPNSTVGKVSRESSDGFYIYVGDTSIDDFNTYADECSEAGFVVDYEKGDRYYRAYDDAGNYLSLSYSGNNVMTIEMKKEEAEETVDNTEKTDIDEETTNEEDTTEEDSDLVDGMRPEFKDAMDKYEDFMNEYCEFMEKYAESDGTDLELLADYADYMSKYADAMEAFEKWEDDDLNSKETAYYIEVQTRINKKLLEAAE